MALARDQKKIARVFAQELRRSGASPRVQKALYAAGLVESNLRNVNYGDRDSLGVLQQRPSQGWGSAAQVTDPRHAAREFLRRAIPLNEGFNGSAGQLAQAVQRSAFPGRYDERGAEADQLRSRFVGGGSAPSQRQQGSAPSAPGFDPGEAPDISGLLEALVPSRQAPAVSAPVAPAFAARAPGRAVPVSGSAPVARQGVDGLIRAAMASGLVPEQAAPEQATASAAPGGKAAKTGGLRPRGSYAGTTGLVTDLARLSGLATSSGKRDTERTASGGVSDHYRGNKTANARDLIGTDAEMAAGAQRIARRLGIKDFKYGSDYSVNFRAGGGVFRAQLITSVHGSGPHVHIGIARVK